MTNNIIFLACMCFAISSIAIGHIIQQEDINDLFNPRIKFNLTDFEHNDNVTYYSYHIHVYFFQKSLKQRKEATVLRNRFLAQFKVDRCDHDCETWCPRICHWNLNISPIG
jgi:hypothetical protein